MKCLPRECESSEFLLRYHAAFLVGVGVEFRLNREPFLGCRVTDEFHDDFPALQRNRPPVGGDVTEHPVFNLVPLARPGRIVGDGDLELRLIRKLLQLQLEEAAATGIAPSTIRCNVELLGLRVRLPSYARPPAADGLHSEFPGVFVDAHRDESRVLREVVDTVGDGLAELLVEEVMALHLAGRALGRPLLPPILVVPDEFFLFGIDGDDRIAPSLDRTGGFMDVQELRVTIRMRRALLRLAIPLEAVLLPVQFLRYGRVADGVPSGRQLPGKFARALTRPPQAAHRIAALCGFDQRIKRSEECRIVLRHPLASSSGLTDRARRERGGRQILLPAGDARARHTCRFLDSHDAAVPESLRLGCAPQTSHAFIQMRREQSVGLLHRCHGRVHDGGVYSLLL